MMMMMSLSDASPPVQSLYSHFSPLISNPFLDPRFTLLLRIEKGLIFLDHHILLLREGGESTSPLSVLGKRVRVLISLREGLKRDRKRMEKMEEERKKERDEGEKDEERKLWREVERVLERVEEMYAMELGEEMRGRDEERRKVEGEEEGAGE